MKNLALRTAVILCGGKGTRLGSLSKKTPKSLVKINNQPIIWFIIKNLIKNSFNHFILPVGYKGNLIKNYIKRQKEFKNLKIEIVNTGTNTHIAKRIFLIKKKIKSKNFLLMNGDAIFDFNLKKMYEDHEKKLKHLTFLGCENQLAYGTVGVLNNKIINFERNITFNSVKTRKNSMFTAYVYSGMSIMSKSILKLNFKHFKNFEKQLYPQVIKKYKCDLKEFNGFWHSVDNMKDIENTKKNNNYQRYNKIKKLMKKIR
jgi:glucose-1-phosphate cytidylyltransferase